MGKAKRSMKNKSFISMKKVLFIIFNLICIALAEEKKVDDVYDDFSHIYGATKMKDGSFYVSRIKGDLKITDDYIFKYIENVSKENKIDDSSKNYILLIKAEFSNKDEIIKFKAYLMPLTTASFFSFTKGVESVKKVSLE
jgi:hypothetical protein